jgi:hypothetical protein
MSIKPLIDKVLITLEVEDKTSVLVLLAKDGTISRKGDGSLNHGSLPLCQGISNDGHFEALMTTVNEDIFPYVGVINNPLRAGRDCKLSIIFQGPNGVDYSFRVLYGEDAQGPPKELAQILINAVKITDPWYLEQLHTEKEEQKQWWQFWKRSAK